jgi:hypothetical protein
MSLIYGFHHICFDKNGKEIFEEQLKTIRDSGLYDASHTIFCSVLGNKNNYTLPSKYKVIFTSKDGKAYERPVLEHMYKHSLTNPGKYWYIHTKGISHFRTKRYEPVRDWRVYMEYYLIKNWKRCVADLDNYDIAGVNYATNPSHYSGNFWWARSSYIKTNNPNFTYKDYYETEMWLCKGKNPIGISYHTSNALHYENRYSPSEYEDYPQMPLIFTPGLSETICNNGLANENLDFNNFEIIAPRPA